MNASKKILIYAALACAIVWLVDTLADWAIFVPDEKFIDLLLFNVHEQEIFNRLIGMLVILIFALFVWAVLLRQQQAEEKLRENEKFLSSIIDQSPFSTWIADANATNIRQNEAYRELMGLDSDSQTVGRYNLLEDQQLLGQGLLGKLEHVFLGGEPVSFLMEYDLAGMQRFGGAGSGVKLLRTTIFPVADELGRVINAVVQHEDITERKKVEDAIRESEDRFRRIFDVTRDVMALIDTSGVVRWANRAWCEVFSPGPGTRVNWLEIVHPDDLPAFQARWDSVLGSAAEITNLEFRYRTLKDQFIYLETTLRHIELRNEKVLFFDGYDVTLRKRAERRLAEEKEKLAVTLGSLAEGVIAADGKGRVMLINQAAQELTGWSASQAEGQVLTNVFRIYPEDRSSDGESLLDHLGPEDEIVLPGGDYLLAGREGGSTLIAATTAPVLDSEGLRLGQVIVFRDVARERKVERELARANKLESIGTLAGGIAHDFNNILTSVLGNIELAGMFAGENEKVRKTLEQAWESGNAAKELTSRLLTFSRGGRPVKKRTDIGVLIEESLALCLAGTNVKGEAGIAEGLRPVEVDAAQFSQVLNILLINAVQAMPAGGVITVKAENAAAVDTDAISRGLGPFVVIYVTDTGEGISRENLLRIFDPFFTTREKGSGMGLAIAYSIIQRHGGRIDVQSEPGRGSTFRIILPALKAEERPRAKLPAQDRPAGKLRILVMDDDESVRDITVKMLEHLGHDAFGTADGREAVEIFSTAREEGRPFDLAFLDLTVPGGLGGKDTLKLLAEIDPDVKAVVTTGYSNDTVLSNYAEIGFAHLLVKPFQIDQIRLLLGSLFASGLPAT